MKKLLNITELSKQLDLVDPNTKRPLNHILRYWEKEFKEIRPKKINNRRYYSLRQVEIIKKIKFLLKIKGMTVLGVKKYINSRAKKLDEYYPNSLEANYYKNNIKTKSKLILEKIRKIKEYGKKNSP